MDECAYVKEGVTPRAAADADGRGRHTIHVSEERQTDVFEELRIMSTM